MPSLNLGPPPLALSSSLSSPQSLFEISAEMRRFFFWLSPSAVAGVGPSSSPGVAVVAGTSSAAFAGVAVATVAAAASAAVGPAPDPTA